jgi:hypothetical protein
MPMVLPSMEVMTTVPSAIGLGRTGERRAKTPRGPSVWRGDLHDQVARAAVDPVEHLDRLPDGQAVKARLEARD